MFFFSSNVPTNRRIRRLDLTAPTRSMGTRKLLKQGTLLKARSRRKLHAFLCNDILVLTDETMKTLYRLVGKFHSGNFHL